MHLVGIAHLGPGFLGHRGDGLGIQGAEVVGGFRVGPAAVLHGLGAALFQRRVIEEGVGPRAEDFRRQGRGRRQVAGDELHLAALHAPQQCQPTLGIHGFVQAIVEGLGHQRVVGDLAFAHQVLLAGHLVGEHAGQQVFAAHALDLRRHLAPAGEARQGQGGGSVPAPAHAEQRRVQYGLHQHLFGAVGMQVAPDLLQREAVAGGEGQDERVLGGRRLQLEVEVAAEALAQRQAPGAVEPAAERRMDDQLHAAGFVEEALHHQALLGRQGSQRGLCPRQVFDDLPRRRLTQANTVAQAPDRPLDGLPPLGLLPSPPGRGVGGEGCLILLGLSKQLPNLPPQPRHRSRQLITPPRRLAQPEGNARRLPAGVLHPHPPGLHTDDAVRLVAQLEHIAGQAFHGEILVHAAHRHALGLQQHGVVGGFRNGAAGGDGGQACRAPAAQTAVHRVAVEVGATHALAAAVALGQHLDQGVELATRKVGVGHGAGHQVKEFVLAPFLAGHFGDHLLGQHIERRMGDGQGVQFVAAHAVQQRRAFDQVVPRLREQPPLGRAADAVAGTPDPLQEGGDAAWRTDLADQLHVADIDAQLQ
ncbi:hypothetical protein D9M68_437840 [compost metagenome]